MGRRRARKIKARATNREKKADWCEPAANGRISAGRVESWRDGVTFTFSQGRSTGFHIPVSRQLDWFILVWEFDL